MNSQVAELVDAKNCNEVCPTFTLNKKGINAEVRKQLQVRILVLTIFLTIKTNNMNAKEEIILELKARIAHHENYKRHHLYDSEFADRQIELFTNLIAATESAIFDLPSEEEMVKECMKFTDIAKDKTTSLFYTIGFGDAVNFIHNYKKPEPDGK